MTEYPGCDERPDEICPQLVIAIGGSAGSYREIEKITQSLPNWFQGTILIATHRSPSNQNTLVKILGNRAQVRVIEPEDEDCLECTTIYVGNPKDRVEVNRSAFDINEDTSLYARMRRIDDLFLSVAKSSGRNSVGVILSGMLNDGVEGLQAIHEAGGTCFVQNPTEAEQDSMPLQALSAVPTARVGTTDEIESWLMDLSIKKAAES